MGETVRTSQNQACYQELRRLLSTGQVRPGIRLAEKSWATRLGVHRAALREAMILLAHEGLLRRGERGGYFTPLLEQHDLDQVMQVRAILEVGANDRLISTYHRAPLPLMPSRLTDPHARRRAAIQTIGEHRAIQDAVCERRIAEAIDLLERHLRTAHQLKPVY